MAYESSEVLSVLDCAGYQAMGYKNLAEPELDFSCNPLLTASMVHELT